MGEENKNITVELVCTGGFITTKDKLAYTFQEVRSDGSLSPEILSWDKFSGQPGTVYTVESSSREAFDQKGSIFTNSCRYLRSWPNRDQAAEWQAKLNTAQVNLTATKAEEKEKVLMDEFRNRLRPIRRFYQKTNYQNKQALIAIVIRELQRPLDDDEE